MSRAFVLWLVSPPSTIAGLWLIAWLWHVGPENSAHPVWWAVPYWISSILAGVVLAFILTGVAYGIIDYLFKIKVMGARK